MTVAWLPSPLWVHGIRSIVVVLPCSLSAQRSGSLAAAAHRSVGLPGSYRGRRQVQPDVIRPLDHARLTDGDARVPPQRAERHRTRAMGVAARYETVPRHATVRMTPRSPRGTERAASHRCSPATPTRDVPRTARDRPPPQHHCRTRGHGGRGDRRVTRRPEHAELRTRHCPHDHRRSERQPGTSAPRLDVCSHQRGARRDHGCSTYHGSKQKENRRTCCPYNVSAEPRCTA